MIGACISPFHTHTQTSQSPSLMTESHVAMFNAADLLHQPSKEFFYPLSEGDEGDVDHEIGPLQPNMFLSALELAKLELP